MESDLMLKSRRVGLFAEIEGCSRTVDQRAIDVS